MMMDQPANERTNEPANEPMNEPVNEPTNEPANEPTNEPANEPTNEPANEPTNALEAANHYDSLMKGFTAITVAAGFVAAIQVQLNSLALITTTEEQKTFAFRAINAVFTAGLVLDINSAILGYLTVRWLERLQKHHRDILNSTASTTPVSQSTRDFIYLTFLALSLIIPFPLLLGGIMCMLAGIYTYVWKKYTTTFAGLITAAGGIVIPFIVGHSFAGWSNEGTREKVVRRLREMQRDR